MERLSCQAVYLVEPIWKLVVFQGFVICQYTRSSLWESGDDFSGSN